MHLKLNTLPPTLLAHLGAYSTLETLAQFPQFALPLSDLRQHKGGESYHVNIKAEGLSLMLQCVNPDAPAEEGLWGLNGITLKAGVWTGEWPVDLNPFEITAKQLVQLFEPKLEEVMDMPPMLCFSIDGAYGQTWSVMAMFDAASKKLSSFSLIRVGEWRKLDATSASTASA